MKHETKELKNRTPQGRLNFSIRKHDRFIGTRKTANGIAEVIEKAPKSWSMIEFRNDLGQRVCINREFMEADPVVDFAGWTADEVIKDWLENATQEDFDERITAMGREFGVTLEW
jgi:hypothetical protein